MTEQEIRELVREELIKETELSANKAQRAREAIEKHVTPLLEQMVGIMKSSDPDKAGWAKSILETQKDVYGELSDFESSMRAQDTKMPGY